MILQDSYRNFLKCSLYFLLWGATCLTLSPVGAGAAPSVRNLSDQSTFSINFKGNTFIVYPYGAVEERAVWKRPEWTPTGEKPIEVCWENISDSSVILREAVKDSVSKTWQHYSMVKFVGWNECKSGSPGIRIGISATESKTVFLGQKIAGITNGMLLRMDYSAFKSCKDRNEYCVRATAVHEFGHALGLAHEQNRDDADSKDEDISWCIGNRKQGDFPDLMLTLYDPQSIMNYCNKAWNNKGLLSEKDIEAVSKLYGARA
ncbi:M12 family metallopeptidase [Pseudomonas ogarae]|uniref:M12 family metallopeptidase n=1 Tax=Pseudomonas ogarae (strain DSM 112162 / CECT 30235 / F113) TaxID=1114970 RepID=UPI0019500952|nr:M12 family metallopeptidase [Pseudomonas ogarae]